MTPEEAIENIAFVIFASANAHEAAKELFSLGYRLIPQLTLLTDEEVDTKLKAFWDKYAGKGLSRGEVMELHHSEMYQGICQAQLDKSLKELED